MFHAPFKKPETVGMFVFTNKTGQAYPPPPQDSINELIIWKMNPLVVPVTSVKFNSELLHA